MPRQLGADAIGDADLGLRRDERERLARPVVRDRVVVAVEPYQTMAQKLGLRVQLLREQRELTLEGSASAYAAVASPSETFTGLPR